MNTDTTKFGPAIVLGCLCMVNEAGEIQHMTDEERKLFDEGRL